MVSETSMNPNNRSNATQCPQNVHKMTLLIRSANIFIKKKNLWSSISTVISLFCSKTKKNKSSEMQASNCSTVYPSATNHSWF